MSLSQTFTKNFTRARKAKQLTQEALAQKAGISVSYVSMLQRGQRTPTLDTIDVLAKALGVNAVELLKA